MKAVESSLSYRYIQTACRSVGRAAECSLIGRTFIRAARFLGPALADSRVFGCGRIVCSVIDDTSRVARDPVPLTVAALARPVLAARSRLAGIAAARGLRAAALTDSVLARGNWPRVAGAGLFGWGCGLLPSRLVESVALMLIGMLLVGAGPALRKALSASLFARLVGVQARGEKAGQAGRLNGVAWLVMFLALLAGVMASGAAEAGSREALPIVVVLAAATILLWHPEAILLVVAAFPWVDWAARNALGASGGLWDDGLLLVSAALLVWSVLFLNRGALRTVPAALPVLLMLAASLASIVFRRVPTDVALYALRVLFAPILFYFIGFLLPKSARLVRWAVLVFVLACTALAIHGLFQFATDAPMPARWVDESESIRVRAYSVVQNPNVLGALLAMGSLITGSLVLSRAFFGLRRLLLAAVCAVLLGGLAVTFSRGAWLGLVVGLVAMAVLAYRRHLVTIAGLGVFAWFAAPRIFIQRLLFTFSSEYATRSSAGLGRLYRWDVSLHHIVDHPLLGLGLGTFGGTTAYMFDYWALWVDNFYLQMAAEGGLLLLAFFLWLLLRGAKGLVRGYREVAGEASTGRPPTSAAGTDGYLKALTAGMFGAFIAVAVANIFEADWETMAVGVEYWFLAGLVTSAALQAPEESEKAVLIDGGARSEWVTEVRD